MAEVKILVEGYAKKFEKGWVASSTCCLITSGDKKIITDPGCNREKLLAALKKENLTTGDIDYIFISHAHLDHSLLAGIFENAKLVTYDMNSTYDKDRIEEFDTHVMGSDVEVIDTPGHMLEHISLLVTTTQGKITIAGDCIFFLVDQEQKFDINQKDHSQAKGMDMATLIESRKKLIGLADYIIPGHGKMFKVEK